MLGEEKKRKIAILKIVLIGVILLTLASTSVNIITNDPSDEPVIEFLPGILLGVFILLHSLTRRNFLILPSIILISLLSFPAYYLSFRWGTMIPQSWILFALTIVMAGVLLNSTYALFLVIFHGGLLLSLTHLQIIGRVKYQIWDQTPMLESAFVATGTFAVIGLISWLSNREIEKALKRANESKAALGKERDMLEIKVEERAKQIRYAQMKQVVELYRFADFGRLAAGLFHDLVDPLSVISLNLENLNHETRRKKPSTEGKANIRSALKMVTENQRRVEAYVNSTRRQLQGQQIRTRFNLKAEIDCVIVGLTPKANTSRVSLEFHCLRPLFTFGNPVRFHQLMHNLISNAIDSYDGVKRRKNRIVLMKLEHKEKQSVCSVEDFGRGISTKHLSQIFTPFFTTKPLDKGIGIGLSIAKDIVERDFKGEISVKSRIHKETLFTVKFPIITK